MVGKFRYVERTARKEWPLSHPIRLLRYPIQLHSIALLIRRMARSIWNWKSCRPECLFRYFWHRFAVHILDHMLPWIEDHILPHFVPSVVCCWQVYVPTHELKCISCQILKIRVWCIVVVNVTDDGWYNGYIINAIIGSRIELLVIQCVTWHNHLDIITNTIVFSITYATDGVPSIWFPTSALLHSDTCKLIGWIPQVVSMWCVVITYWWQLYDHWYRSSTHHSHTGWVALYDVLSLLM